MYQAYFKCRTLRHHCTQKVDPPQDSEFEHMAHGAVSSYCPSVLFFRDGCSSTVSEACKQPTSTCTGTTDDTRIGNNHYTLIHTPHDDCWIALYHASNHATYPLSLSSSPVTSLSLHHTMGRSLGYSTGRRRRSNV